MLTKCVSEIHCSFRGAENGMYIDVFFSPRLGNPQLLRPIVLYMIPFTITFLSAYNPST